MAETAQQLLVGLQLLGQLQPFTITLAKDMSVPAASWPNGTLVGYAVVLAGLPPPAPRTILDLYQVPVGRGQVLPVPCCEVVCGGVAVMMLSWGCVPSTGGGQPQVTQTKVGRDRHQGAPEGQRLRLPPKQPRQRYE